jgi:hypothetical protein
MNADKTKLTTPSKNSRGPQQMNTDKHRFKEKHKKA